MRVEDTIRGPNRGWLEVPEGVELGDFILFGGRLQRRQVFQKPLTLDGLIARYRQGVPSGAKNLQVLDLSETKVTEKGLKDLKEALPECKIVSN